MASKMSSWTRSVKVFHFKSMKVTFPQSFVSLICVTLNICAVDTLYNPK